ncbi:DUF3047 domain-containing protein [Desulfocicer niacini]
MPMHIKKRILYMLFSGMVLWGNLLVADTSEPPLVVGPFSSSLAGEAFPPGWEPMVFDKIKNHTTYTLVKEDGVVVIKAHSNASSSGLIHRITIDPLKYPVISWRWKTENLLQNADVTLKSGDDYPARIYITFAYDGSKVGFLEKAKLNAAKLIYGEYPPMGAINYIWDTKAPEGTSVPNVYTDKVMMVVVESGSAGLNTWVEEKQNILEDYRRLFGQEPPMISGIAIMTDTDNTGEAATTFYGDIIFSSIRE